MKKEYVVPSVEITAADEKEDILLGSDVIIDLGSLYGDGSDGTLN